ncbi:MAG TPA: DoxX family protein [Polyangiaceae bacterium]|jgi:uncharacterized membrane protein YphA (DoxX/SURF4 family)|nr:DoxX family protein [Polyangiaceae bacterium]
MTTAQSAFEPQAVATRSRTTTLRRATTVARFLLGTVFFVFGLNGFLNFIPQPPPAKIPAGAAAFGAALLHTGYLFQLLKGTEVIAGVALLANRWVPLALAILAPIVINIFAFHAFLAPGEIGVAIVVLALELYLAWAYRAAFKPMLNAHTTLA